MQLYRRIDKSMKRRSQASGLSCPDSCGACCTSPKVEATVLELLPLARELWQQGRADSWLERLAAADAPCVFYDPDPNLPGNGRCRVYFWRPLICRLFGFSYRKNKYGIPELVTCRIIKSTCPDRYARVMQQHSSEAVTPMTQPACMSDNSAKLAAIDPSLGTRLLPINQAARQAIERMGLLREYFIQSTQATETLPSVLQPERPDTDQDPSSPPRAA